MILSFSYDMIKSYNQLKYLGGASGTTQLLQSYPSVIIELMMYMRYVVLHYINLNILVAPPAPHNCYKMLQ